MRSTIMITVILVANLFGAATVYDVDLSANDNYFASTAIQTFVATADSIDTVAFFCGRKMVTGTYLFQLKDAAGFILLGEASSDDADLYEYKIITAGFNQKVYVQKGFTYRLYISHSDSIQTNFYYNSNNPYNGGELIDHPGCDLAARIKGVNNFPGDLFGMNAHITNSPIPEHPDSFWNSRKWKACIDSMKATGITWDRVGMCTWHHFQFRDSIPSDTVYNWDWCDKLMKYYAKDSIKVLWYFTQSTKWTGSDSLWNRYGIYWSFPRNLFEPIFLENGNINPNNYFARYVYKFVKRYGPNGDYWEINDTIPYNPICYYEMWNEPEWGIRDTFWGENAHIFDSLYLSYMNTEGDNISLMHIYSQLCIVGDIAAHKAAEENGASNDINTLMYLPYHHWASDSSDLEHWPWPNVWLNYMKSKNVDQYCDGISFHAYGGDNDTLPSFHNREKLTLDELWNFAKEGGWEDKFLWCTEHSTGYFQLLQDSLIWHPIQACEQLATICSFYANDKPIGSLTHSFLWCYSHLYYGDNGSASTVLFAITQDSLNKRPPGFSYGQMTELLRNCRFNQNMVTDSAQYDSIRTYEFVNTQSNKKVYVAWKERDCGAGTLSYKIPLRTNSGKIEKVAYSSSLDITPANINSAGWATVNLDTVPQFIYEPADSALRRPDLIVDSIWTLPVFPCDSDSVVTYARIKNIGTNSTLDSIFVRFAINGDTISTVLVSGVIPPDSTKTANASSKWLAAHGSYLVRADVNAIKKFVELNFDNNIKYRNYSVPLRPYGWIKINKDSTYTNLPYVVLTLHSVNPNDSLNPPADSMKISQTYIPPETTQTEYATPWVAFDTVYLWYLRNGEKTNTVSVTYKIGVANYSQVFSDVIMLDKAAPTGSFAINDSDRFINTPNVTANNYLIDTMSSLSKMRYGYNYLKNIVINSSFESQDTAHWKTDTAVYIDSLKLFKIPLHAAGNYFYQPIPPASLTGFDNDTMLLAIDLASDSFKGTGKIQFQYIYGIIIDSFPPRGGQQPYPYGTSITIPQGTKANVAQYNHYSYFKYHPDPPPGLNFLEARIGIFVDSNASNTGRLYIDNLRLDVVGPPPSYEHCVNYDTLASKTLSSGNGQKILYGQFQDGAGNETGVLFDSIIVDTTHPSAFISSPESDQTVYDTVEITGCAYDPYDEITLFHHYDLKYKSCDYDDWYGCEPDSGSTEAKYPSFPMPLLGDWDTYKASETWGDGWFDLKLSDLDSASNTTDYEITVYIDNYPDDPWGGLAGFNNEVYGLSNKADIFVGEYGTGKIYRYNQSHQLTDTFQLVDSSGVGFPYAFIQDDSNYLWTANLKSHKISKYTPQGSLIKRFGGDFNQPSGIAMDKQGNLWITDRQHHKVKKFSLNGAKLLEFGERGSDPGKLNQPIGIAIKDSMVYVADSKNKRISVFDTTGSFKRTIGVNAGFELPCGLAIDTTGCLFVSDFTGNKIIEFGPYDNRILKIDTLLNGPAGLSLSEDQKTLFVTDAKNKRVVAFKVRGTPPQHGGGQAAGDQPLKHVSFTVYPTIFTGRLYIKLQAIAGRKLTLKIYDVTGRLVNKLLDNTVMMTDQTIIWNGKDEYNRGVSNGIYFLQVDIDGKKKTNKALMIK